MRHRTGEKPCTSPVLLWNHVLKSLQDHFLPFARWIATRRRSRQVCDMDRLYEICDKHGIAVVEDCAHALGVTWRGEQLGNRAKVSFSFCFFPRQWLFVSLFFVCCEGTFYLSVCEYFLMSLATATIPALSRYCCNVLSYTCINIRCLYSSAWSMDPLPSHDMDPASFIHVVVVPCGVVRAQLRLQRGCRGS